jgi:hypothetical protein
MLDEVELKFNEIIEVFERNNNSTDLVKKAYAVARELHKDQRRKDGKMYILHPLEVALILAKLNFDEKVVSSAILHDVVEDCGYTIEEVTREFGKTVAEMVDCVSAIDETKYIFDAEEIFEDRNFEKASIEEQSFKKLIAIGKKNPLGFCIKFADRLHNLRTIQCFPMGKQLEKVKEALKTSRYGRCVFRCTNNVVDHQVVNMQYEDDVTVQLTMCGFTKDMSRYVKVMGTMGEIIADQVLNIVRVRTFMGEEIVYDINQLTDDLSGHGGGDNQMMTDMFMAIDNKSTTDSNIVDSISSHMQAFAAEYSRTHNGVSITIKEYEDICKKKGE